MITEMLSSVSIGKAYPLPRSSFSPAYAKPFRPSFISCLGKNAESNGSSSGPSQLELGNQISDENTPQMRSGKLEGKGTGIWQLFREAQGNILYLNRQRIMAMEELDRVKSEKSSLLDRIEQLERTKLINTRKDKFSISAELLLRIDSMLLTSLIESKEASEYRRLVMDSKVSIADYFSEIMHKQDTELLVELRHFLGNSRKSGYHIIHICTEMAPVVSVGSLAVYVTGLSRALQRKGNLVEVILPKYASLNLNEVHGFREVEAEFHSCFNGQLHGNRIWTGVVYGIGVTFIEPLNYSSFFSRENIYGYSNDFERFTYFSRASLDYIVKAGKQPDVLHIHNWETSIVGPLFWDVFVNQGLEGTRILLTCQSFESQCIEQPEKLALCGLDSHELHRSDRLQDNNKSHLVNVLKAGVVYSNKVIIMSSMQTKGQVIHATSHGLEPTLSIHKDKLVVAPPVFDSSAWDPSVDKFLPQNYSADNMKGKSVCKVSLQQHLGLLEKASIILVGCIFPDISDIELEKLKNIIGTASRRGVQFVFMGSGQTRGLNTALEYFEEELKDENMRFLNKYDEALAHLVFAGSDIMLCPSFDDTLQVPLKAMRYGAMPILLNFPYSKFGHFVDHDLEGTELSRFIEDTFHNMPLNQAIAELKNNRSKWDKKMVDAMTKDFSCDAECCDIHISAYTAIKNL